MKQTAVLHRPYAAAGPVLLLLSLFFIAGCSNGSDAGANAAARYGLERSEFVALKKAGKDSRYLKKVMEKKIAKLREEGFVVETTTSKQKTKKPR